MTSRRLANVSVFCVSLIVALLSAATPSDAASVTALDFDLRTNEINAFLVESSRLAEGNGVGKRLLTLARRERADRPRLVSALTDWAVEERWAAREADFGPSLDMLGPIVGPIDRSVTVVLHQGRPILPGLAMRKGAAFDTLYVSSQIDALGRLVAFYVDFIENGDDEALRRLAVHDLPRVRQFLAEARRL